MQLLQQARHSIRRVHDARDVSEPVPAVSVLTAREVPDSPTKPNVRFKTGGALFQIPVVSKRST